MAPEKFDLHAERVKEELKREFVRSGALCASKPLYANPSLVLWMKQTNMHLPLNERFRPATFSVACLSGVGEIFS